MSVLASEVVGARGAVLSSMRQAPSMTVVREVVADPAAERTRPTLSRREVEVLLGWLAAESKEEAASKLFISASTVSTHIARIRAKYDAVGRPAPTKAHLLARALQDGLTTLDRW